MSTVEVAREKRNSHKHEAAAQPSNSEPVQIMQRNQREKEPRNEYKSVVKIEGCLMGGFISMTERLNWNIERTSRELSSPQLTQLQEGHQNKYAFQRYKQEPNVNGAGSGVGGESEGYAANLEDNVLTNQSNKLPVGICISPSEDECNSNNPMTTTCAKERSCQLQNISEA
ncbi:hypothetical protein Aperf_G00000082700 [Anoplocephala perfoliata]